MSFYNTARPDQWPTALEEQSVTRARVRRAVYRKGETHRRQLYSARFVYNYWVYTFYNIYICSKYAASM